MPRKVGRHQGRWSFLLECISNRDNLWHNWCPWVYLMSTSEGAPYLSPIPWHPTMQQSNAYWCLVKTPWNTLLSCWLWSNGGCYTGNSRNPSQCCQCLSCTAHHRWLKQQCHWGGNCHSPLQVPTSGTFMSRALPCRHGWLYSCKFGKLT